MADRPSGSRGASRASRRRLATAKRSTRTWAALVAPRVAAAAIACILLSLWGITVGTVVGWKASESLMGLSTEMFFMMMLKMMWFRDVVGLVVKGILFGALPAAICCFEGLSASAERGRAGDAGDQRAHPAHGLAPPCERAGFPRGLPVDGGDSDHELELVHAGLSRGPVLRPDIAAAAAGPVERRRAAWDRRRCSGREPG